MGAGKLDLTVWSLSHLSRGLPSCPSPAGPSGFRAQSQPIWGRCQRRKEGQKKVKVGPELENSGHFSSSLVSVSVEPYVQAVSGKLAERRGQRSADGGGRVSMEPFVGAEI